MTTIKEVADRVRAEAERPKPPHKEPDASGSISAETIRRIADEVGKEFA